MLHFLKKIEKSILNEYMPMVKKIPTDEPQIPWSQSSGQILLLGSLLSTGIGPINTLNKNVWECQSSYTIN